MKYATIILDVTREYNIESVFKMSNIYKLNMIIIIINIYM